MKKVFGFGLLIAAVMMVAFASCKKDQKVESVTLSATTKSIKVGEEFTLKATVTPADAKNKAVTWESDKPAVATVDKNGKVKGIAAGEATITVTTVDENKTATCKVTVTASSDPDPKPDPDDNSAFKNYEPETKTTMNEEWNAGKIEVVQTVDPVNLVFLETDENANGFVCTIALVVDKNATKLPEATYNVVDIKKAALNTIIKSTGIKNNQVSPSYISKTTTENGKKFLATPFYFFASGTATVSATAIDFNITSHFGSTLKLKYTGSLNITPKGSAPMRTFRAIR
ncbi:MAG: Ig domain-containing protein [Bacteroidota bacterium]|jgi:pullulanase family protein